MTEEEEKSKQEELSQDKNACDAAPCKIKTVGNSSFRRKNAVLNNFDGQAFKYISNHE